MNNPVIGLTLDSEPPGGYSSLPWYALRQNYCAAITRAGGLPVLLPHEPEQAAAYLTRLDGLVITGGAFDVAPEIFGAESRHSSVTTKDRRTDFELAIARAAYEKDAPTLGICGGQQLLNVARGGTLLQHIPDSVDGAIAHEQPGPRDRPGHTVRIEPGTQLHAIVGKDEMAVNSAHHQAVDELGDGLLANAHAPDGVNEGIEAGDRRFWLGVQWHPEYGVDPADDKIIAALIAACRG